MNEQISEHIWQTIDRERGIVLSKARGPDIEGYYHFELVLDNQTIQFSAPSNDRVHGSPKLGEENLYEMTWNISDLFIPVPLQNQAKEILVLIEEALKEWGWNYRPEKAASVTVGFEAKALKKYKL